MKFIAVILFALSISAPGRAQDNKDGAETMSTLEKTIARVKAQIADAKSPAPNCLTQPCSDKDVEALVDKLRKAQALQGQAQSAVSEVEKNRLAASKAKTNEVDLKSIADQIAKLHLENEYAEIKSDANTTDAKAQLLVAKYDKTVMGAYLQDKFGQFVNSKLACTMMKRCSVVQKQPIDPKDMDELFKDQGANRRSNYYDQMRSGGH